MIQFNVFSGLKQALKSRFLQILESIEIGSL